MSNELQKPTVTTCPDCAGTGGGHPDDIGYRCHRCGGTGGIPDDQPARQKTTPMRSGGARIEQDGTSDGDAPRITSHGLAQLLLSMPDAPVLTECEGIVVRVLGAHFAADGNPPAVWIEREE